MKKDLREVEALVQIVEEYASVQKNIARSPLRGGQCACP